MTTEVLRVSPVELAYQPSELSLINSMYESCEPSKLISR